MATLKEARQMFGCSQVDLSRWTGISLSKIRAIELGRRTPTASEIQQIQHAFDRASAHGDAVRRYEGHTGWPGLVQEDMEEFVRKQGRAKTGKK